MNTRLVETVLAGTSNPLGVVSCNCRSLRRARFTDQRDSYELGTGFALQVQQNRC